MTIDVENLALQFHNLGEYSGFQCWELEHLYKTFFEYRLAEFRKNFEELCTALVEKQVENKHRYVEEWSIEVKKTQHFPNEYYENENEKDKVFSYYLSGVRSSMGITYECTIYWPKDEMIVKCYDYNNKLLDNFVLPLDFPYFKVNFDQYQRFSLFSNWFYRLYQDWLYCEQRQDES